MGNICGEARKQSENETAQTTSKNSTVCQYEVSESCRLELVLGTYRSHRADLLLVFAQPDSLEYSAEIKDYAQNYLDLLDYASQHKNPTINVHVNPTCPYKRLVVVLLRPYNTHQADLYFQEFQHIIQETLSSVSEFVLQISQTPQNGNGVPNQTLVSLFLKYLKRYKKSIRIYFIASQLRFLNMVRYQMSKLGAYVPLNYRDKEL